MPHAYLLFSFNNRSDFRFGLRITHNNKRPRLAVRSARTRPCVHRKRTFVQNLDFHITQRTCRSNDVPDDVDGNRFVAEEAQRATPVHFFEEVVRALQHYVCRELFAFEGNLKQPKVIDLLYMDVVS